MNVHNLINEFFYQKLSNQTFLVGNVDLEGIFVETIKRFGYIEALEINLESLDEFKNCVLVRYDIKLIAHNDVRFDN